MLTLSGGSPSRWPLFSKIHNILSNDAGGLDETAETQEESMEGECAVRGRKGEQCVCW